MAEQSYLFDFTRTDDFFENFNIKFKISDMFHVSSYDASTQTYSYSNNISGEKFTLHLVKYGGVNIDEYLDSTATYSKLLSSVTANGNAISVDMNLDWYNRGNGEASIELHDDVTFEIGDDNIPIRAIILCCDDYVMGYSINTKPFSVTNQVVLDDDVIFWDISRFNQ